MYKPFLVVSIALVGCAVHEDSGISEHAPACSEIELRTLNSLDGKKLNCPLADWLSKFSDMDWRRQDHWMSPVFDNSCKFDELLVGRCTSGGIDSFFDAGVIVRDGKRIVIFVRSRRELPHKFRALGLAHRPGGR